MNYLAKIKLSNTYDLVLNNLDVDSGEDPITDVEGTTILLLDDGTSWQYIDAEWSQIELEQDRIILTSLYPFLMSICESIDNDFIKYQLSTVYEGVLLTEADDIVTFSGLSSVPKVVAGDHIFVTKYVKKYTTGDYVSWSDRWAYMTAIYLDLYGIELPEEPIEDINRYLTRVVSVTDTSISVDNLGADIRIVDLEEEIIGVFFVSFPVPVLNAMLDMMGYDIFKRDAKETRSEKLGNYTVSNFDPTQYYGAGAYPKSLQNVIDHWDNSGG